MSKCPSHIVATDDDKRLKCLHCGAISDDMAAVLPIEIAALIGMIRDFENAHWDCPQQEPK